MQTINPLYIGSLEKNFEKYYEELSLLNYNYIHFHSFQKLNSENNIYLIQDHNDLNNNIFTSAQENSKIKYQILLNTIKNLKNKYNIGAITDIILHQISSESSWIYNNKDSTFNLKNTPWLNAAFELDKIFLLYLKKKMFCIKKHLIFIVLKILMKLLKKLKFM